MARSQKLRLVKWASLVLRLPLLLSGLALVICGAFVAATRRKGSVYGAAIAEVSPAPLISKIAAAVGPTNMLRPRAALLWVPTFLP